MELSGDCRNFRQTTRNWSLSFANKFLKHSCLMANNKFRGIVSMNTIRKEAHLHGFHGRACHITNCSVFDIMPKHIEIRPEPRV
ncbi:hypothetical protein CEXT_766021 [Caerostris extrusa]|uniref:Uncharacterized protein n=1 Tax=Caerostris extrusa TaxID=172846 RepID=A0AAV4N9S8_CAEEX|nr:hypothetical protein CEXT_766021 [Caerostris extrusa]